MYSAHNPAIAAYMHSSAAAFKRGAWFAILSIRQPITAVPDQLAQVAAGNYDPLFGHKLNAFDYLETHSERLWQEIRSAADNAQRLTILCQCPGLGIVKSGFILQLMGYNVACLDSRNIKREGRNINAFRTRGPKSKSGKAFARKVTNYLRETEGKSAEYWDAWCADVARVYDLTPHAVSELHMSIVPEEFVPF